MSDIENNTAADSKTPTPNHGQKFGAFAALKITNFRFMLSGAVLAHAVQWSQSVIISWLVYDMTGSGTMLGTVSLVSTLSSICVLPFIGYLIDHFNRRLLISLENSIFLAINLAIGLLLLSGHSSMVFLFGFAFVNGILHAVDGTLRQVLVFDLVPRESAPNAVALLQTGWSVMRVIGPAIGGLLIAWFSAGTNFFLTAAVYLLVGITILQIKFPKQKLDTARSSGIQNIKEGVSFVLKDRVTRTFTLMGIILPLMVIPIFAILPPIYAVQVYNDTTGMTIGYLTSAVGVGGILGGVVTASLGRFEHRGRLQLAALFLMSVSLIIFAFCSYLPLALICLAIAGFFEMIFLTINQIAIQLAIPDAIRAKVTAVVSLTFLTSPLGNMIAGAGSDLLGGPKNVTILLAGSAAIVGILLWLFSPTVRNYSFSKSVAKQNNS